MIYLSGDLHHASLRTGNQRHCDRSELQVARLYTDMLRDAGVKVTYFVSGKCFTQEWNDLESIVQQPNVEIGGHNFNCFQPMLLHRFFKKATGSFNGPAWYQRRDALKTIRVAEQKTGKRLRLWRNHMYMHGPYTDDVLASVGIELCSDGVRKQGTRPTPTRSGLLEFLLNVMPDHEHIYHAERTPEYVNWFVKRYSWSDDYGSDSYHVEEWTDRVLEELRDHESRGIPSNMLIHPITLYLADRFRSFGRILDFLASHPTHHLGELLERKSTSLAPSDAREVPHVA